MTSKKSVRPDDRVSVLRLRQSLKMARSAHAYVRGSTIKFYEWLEQQEAGQFASKGRRSGYAAIATSATLVRLPA